MQEAINQAVNRGHSRVELSDIEAASREYSQYALDALIVEDDPRSNKLEGILYQLPGTTPCMDAPDLIQAIKLAGVGMDDAPRYLEILLDTNFLGIPDGSGGFEYPVDESRRITAQRVAEQIAKNRNQTLQFEINPVFRPVLQIN
jgi:hypothetical protein